MMSCPTWAITALSCGWWASGTSGATSPSCASAGEIHADTGPDMLQHDGQEGGVVIRGHVELTVGTESRVLGPGDAYYFDSQQPHRFRNVGDEICEVVSASSPPTF